MKQLRSLDLWASNITEMDIELLAELPHLEYLSIGGPGDDWGGCTDQSCHRDPVRFNAETLVPRLQAIRSLKRVWLDGVQVSRRVRSTLESRYESVRITER